MIGSAKSNSKIGRAMGGAVVPLTLFVAGCATGPVTVPDYFYDEGVTTALAQRISDACPTLSYNKDAERAALTRMAQRASVAGYTTAQIAVMARSVDKTLVQAKFDAQLQARGLTDADADAYCAVGEREILEGSALGSYLTEAAT